MEILRDQNFRTVGAGIGDGEVLMLRVDSNDRLLVDIASPAGSGMSGNIAKRDQNHVPVSLFVNDNDVPVEALVDDDGRLLCQFN